MNDKELKDECMENAEIDFRNYSNSELTQIREAMRMYADCKLKLFAIPDVIKSVCDHPQYDILGCPFDNQECEKCQYFPSQTVL